VAAMKTEINLRTREFTIAREFYWPRVLATLAVLGVFVLFLGGSVFIYLFKLQLGIENKNLYQEKIALELEIAPLNELEAKVINLEKRAILYGLLEKSVIPWSQNFNIIFHLADANGLRANVMFANAEGNVQIEGKSATMRQVSLFTQALAAEQNSSSALHKIIAYNDKENQFDYGVAVTIVPGGDQ
jgi:hypothetical protein